MDPVERVLTLLGGRRADRPAVSFWHHFPADQVAGPAAVQAHLDHLDRFGLDFLKVMNDNPYPHPGRIGRAEELASIGELRGDEEGFGRQLELLGELRRRLAGRVLMTTTIFNAWATLRHLVRPPTEHLPPNLDASADAASAQVRQWMQRDPGAVRGALERVGRSLANFAARCLAAGADGVFLSVRDDWLDAPGGPKLYQDAVRPTDLAILSAAGAGRLNIVHVCGRPIDFPAFAAYPVHAISWADRAAGPAIRQVAGWARPALCAGVDNLGTLPSGTVDDVQREVADALQQAGARSMIVAPGCTYDPNRVPEANLRAMVEAVKAA